MKPDARLVETGPGQDACDEEHPIEGSVAILLLGWKWVGAVRVMRGADGRGNRCIGIGTGKRAHCCEVRWERESQV